MAAEEHTSQVEPQVNIYEAKTHFSKLIERVCQGEEIIIAKSGIPVARLAPLNVPQRPRIPGTAKGKVVIAEDFDAPLADDILDAFEW